MVTAAVLSSRDAMRHLSATEAISPAIERTQDLLGRPFRWRTFLKIAAVAFFAEVGGGSCNFNAPGRSGGLENIPPAIHGFIVAFAVLLGLVFLVIGLIMFYVGSRLQLVLVELVATRQPFVSPIWRRYGTQTWRWIGLKILFFLFSLLIVLILTAPIIFYFVVHFHGFGGFSSNAFSGMHVLAIVLTVLVLLVVVIVFVAAYMLLRDFALPSIAFEDVSISESLRRLRFLLEAEPGQVALFVFLRIILGIVLAIAGEIGMVFVALITLIPFGLIGGGLWLGLHKAGAAGTAILIACAIVGGLIFLCWMVCLGIGVLGSVYVFCQAYALYFLGGRYPLLGDLLDRSTPPPFYAFAPGFPPQPSQPPV
jgi:hypothetical protein